MKSEEIARQIGCSGRKVCWELAKGETELLNSDYSTRIEYSADIGQTYTISFSYKYIWNEHPEYEGINMIQICKDGNWGEKLIIGKNYYKE